MGQPCSFVHQINLIEWLCEITPALKVAVRVGDTEGKTEIARGGGHCEM
jgi:hypothetical protein